MKRKPPAPYDRNARCKVCKSNLCDDIDEFLKKGESYQKIADWANKMDPDIKLSKVNIWSHNTKHRLINATEEEKKEKKVGRKGGNTRKILEKPLKVKKEKLPKIKKVKKSKNKKDKESKKNDIKPEKVTEFLDTIITRVKERIDNNEIKPTITEAIRATELKVKIEKDNPYEDVLLKFVEGISN